jgi:maltose O-acetyltransferase
MLDGEWFCTPNFELARLHTRAQKMVQDFNALPAFDLKGRAAALDRLLHKIGEGTNIEPPFFVDYGFNVSIGRNTYINLNCILIDGNSITIGDGVMLSPGVRLLTTEHPASKAPRIEEVDGAVRCYSRASPIHIEDHAWLGAGVTVLPGVTIGRHSVIGAGSIVTKSIPVGVLAVGSPCKVLRELPDTF